MTDVRQTAANTPDILTEQDVKPYQIGGVWYTDADPVALARSHEVLRARLAEAQAALERIAEVSDHMGHKGIAVAARAALAARPGEQPCPPVKP